MRAPNNRASVKTRPVQSAQSGFLSARLLRSRMLAGNSKRSHQHRSSAAFLRSPLPGRTSSESHLRTPCPIGTTICIDSTWDALQSTEHFKRTLMAPTVTYGTNGTVPWSGSLRGSWQSFSRWQPFPRLTSLDGRTEHSPRAALGLEKRERVPLQPAGRSAGAAVVGL
jgi:hypothetical protein